MRIEIELLWADDAFAGAALAALDALRAVNQVARMRRRSAPPIAWRFVRPDGSRARIALPGVEASPPAVGSRGPRAARALIVPGWHARSGPHLDRLIRRDAGAGRLAREIHASGGVVVGVYTGVLLLAAAGLLDGRRVAAPWPFHGSAKRLAAGAELVAEAPIVVDGRIVTCGSPAFAMQVALQAVAVLGEADLAESVANAFEHSAQRQSLFDDALRHQVARQPPEGTLARASAFLRANLDRPYSLAETARAAAVSERTLLRQFRSLAGTTPLVLLQRLRVARARILLEMTYQSVATIAQHCGYQDLPAFRRLFRRETGTTPARYRERFRLRASRHQWKADEVVEALERAGGVDASASRMQARARGGPRGSKRRKLQL